MKRSIKIALIAFLVAYITSLVCRYTISIIEDKKMLVTEIERLEDLTNHQMKEIEILEHKVSELESK